MAPVRRHCIGGSHCAECHGLLIGAFVAHHSHTLHGEENHTGLPNLVVERNFYFSVSRRTGRHAGGEHAPSLIHVHADLIIAQAANENVVSFLQHPYFLARDVAENAHRQSGTGEGVAIDKVFGHAHLASHAAHLVFEEPLQRFADAQVHFLRQSAHIVVTLDDLAGNVERFDAIRVDRALCQPLRIGDFHGFCVKYVDESRTDDLAFAFRLFHSGEFCEELVAGIDADHVQTETFIVVHHGLELIFAEQTMVNEYTSESIADSFVQQNGRHRRIDAARESEDDAVVAQLLAQFGYGAVHERGRTPVLSTAADVHHKVAQQLRSLQRVEYLRMELHSPQSLVFSLVGRKFHLRSGSDATEMVGDGRDGIAVAHPYLRIGDEVFEERIVVLNRLQVCATVFSTRRRFHFSPVELCHVLCSIANA